MPPLVQERTNMAGKMTGGPIGGGVGMWNTGSLNGKRDVCEELRKMIINVLLAKCEMEKTEFLDVKDRRKDVVVAKKKYGVDDVRAMARGVV